MTSAESVRRLTGTVMAAARGGAVSAAIWAGERIWRARPTPDRQPDQRRDREHDRPWPERLTIATAQRQAQTVGRDESACASPLAMSIRRSQTTAMPCDSDEARRRSGVAISE